MDDAATGAPAALVALAGWVQASAASTALRKSLWVYPLVNVAHVVGLAALFGAIGALDLRLLGWARAEPLGPLRRVLVPVAAGGLALAALSGLAMLAARPLDYIASPLFGAKMALVVLATANALALRGAAGWGRRDPAPGAAVPARWRLAAALSLALWLAVIVCGRLIGYR